MAIFCGDTFVEVSDTNLDAHTSTGPNAGVNPGWTISTTLNTMLGEVIGGAGVLRATTGSGLSIYRADTPSSGLYQEVELDLEITNGTRPGTTAIALRADTTDNCYWVRPRPQNNRIEIYPWPGGGVIASFDYTMNTSDRFRLKVSIEDSGGQDLFKIFIDDIEQTWTSGGGPVTREASSLNVGFMLQTGDNGADVHEFTGTDDAAAGDTITLTDIGDHTVFQRGSTNIADVGIAGTVNIAAPDTVQYRLVDFGTSTPVAGHDWQTLTAVAASGAFSGTATAVPTGGRYTTQVRLASDVDVNDAEATGWYVGALIPVIGQSNARNLFQTSTGVLTVAAAQWTGTTSSGGEAGDLDAWKPPFAAGSVALANHLQPLLGVPIGLIKYGVGGTSLLAAADAGPGYWLNETAGSPYDDFMQNIVNVQGGKVEAIIWHQGEQEAVSADYGTEYQAGLATLRSNLTRDIAPRDGNASVPFVPFQIGRSPAMAGADAWWTAIRDATRNYADGLSDVYVQTCVDVDVDGTGHYTDAGHVAWAQRAAEGVATGLGISTPFGGPRLVSAAIVTATTTDVTISHAGGTDFTPLTGITGFEVNTGSWITATGARVDATTMRLTHVAGTVTEVRWGYGWLPDVTAPLVDNTPLQYPSVTMSVVANPGQIVTVPFYDEEGTLLASLSGFQIRVEDAATGALVYTDTGVSLSAAGVMTVTDGSLVDGVKYVLSGFVPTAVDANRYTFSGSYTAAAT